MSNGIINKLIKGLKVKITNPKHPHCGEGCEVIEISCGYLYVWGEVNKFTVLSENDFEVIK